MAAVSEILYMYQTLLYLWFNWLAICCMFLPPYTEYLFLILSIFFIYLLQGDCWICMELMDTSLDKFYKFIYEKLQERIPESILGKITVAVSK
jgi:hypothetical protein